ncbi:MAG TPA: hypothetical protein VK158_02675 [Acidobacteriota bacterium]|nr:hypothetical protein [Acidobacteriota bacterium]
MSDAGNSWRKMLLKSRVNTHHVVSRKTTHNLIKQSEKQAQKRLESKKE